MKLFGKQLNLAQLETMDKASSSIAGIAAGGIFT